MEFAKAQEHRALDMAQEDGVEIVFGDSDEEDWLIYLVPVELLNINRRRETRNLR